MLKPTMSATEWRLLGLCYTFLLFVKTITSFDVSFLQVRLTRKLFQPKVSHPCNVRRRVLTTIARTTSRSELSWLAVTPTNSDRRFQLPLESPFEDEQRPRRLLSSVDDTRYDFHVDPNDWGVESIAAPQPQFPNTIDALADDVFEAIAGTLYNKQRLDPNVASNAISRSIFAYRPVRSPTDIGRIGVEIDGAHHLLPHLSEGSAIRRVALVLAAKLSRGHWQGFEERGNTTQQSRPVIVYFNTIKQSLLASQELQLLKRADIPEYNNKKANGKYENVTILCLGQGSEIPSHMRLAKQPGKRRITQIGRGKVDPHRGILLLVQPTDYNDEFQPPGPSIDAVASLQTLVAQATIQELPTVVLSPRFLEATYEKGGAGWDQSGYQQSATFGGAEPPRGPSPWVMRDFTPPVFCWVASALRISPRLLRRSDISSQQLYSRISLMQSVMDPAHPWHIFAVRDTGDYNYIASTKTSSGRPTRDLMKTVFGEWCG